MRESDKMWQNIEINLGKGNAGILCTITFFCKFEITLQNYYSIILKNNQWWIKRQFKEWNIWIEDVRGRTVLDVTKIQVQPWKRSGQLKYNADKVIETGHIWNTFPLIHYIAQFLWNFTYWFAFHSSFEAFSAYAIL